MQKNDVKVSVLINNHNYGNYIAEAIESVLRQSYTNYEIIIIDGNSTDNSRNVIMSFVEKYPDLVTAVFKPTSGQAAAINMGFNISKGDIIAFLDSDDYFFENKLEKIVELHNKYDFVGHARKITNSNGELVTSAAPIDEYEKRSELLHKYGYIYTYNLITSCISVKRELLSKILPMPEDGYITFADCYIKIMAQYYSNIKYICEPLAFYRIHNKQRTNSFADNCKLNEYVEALYNRAFIDVNSKLKKNGQEVIPCLSDSNLKKAFELANPEANIKSGSKYVLYGIGNNAYKIMKYIHILGGHCIYTIDSDKEKWGMQWNGITVLSFDELLKKRSEYQKIIIASAYYQAMEKNLVKLGLKRGKDFIIIRSIAND